MFTLSGLILTILIFIGVAILLRWIANRENPTVFAFVPAQMHALVVTKSSKVTDATKGGGNVSNVVHSIPGKRLNKSSLDPMDWYYENEKEPRGILYRLLGIQFIGFFRYLRLNDIKTFRWGRAEGETAYHMQAKSSPTRYGFFSGQHDIFLEHIETVSILRVNLLMNVIYEEVYPVRVRLRVADPFAVLTMMVTKLAIGILGKTDPKKFIDSAEEQEQLMKAIEEISKTTEEQFGVRIKKASLADVSFDEETAKLLERKARASIEAEANLITATNLAEQEIAKAKGDKEARILRNEGDAHRVEHVIKPLAENDRTVQVAGFDAYRDNETVTTLVLGQGATPVVPLGK